MEAGRPERVVSAALQAYALMATPADKGRCDVTQRSSVVNDDRRSGSGFLLAAILIAVTPAGAVISMSTGMRHGYLAALLAILGLQAAILLHADCGARRALALPHRKRRLPGEIFGAAYLVWRAPEMARPHPRSLTSMRRRCAARVCFQGCWSI